MNRRHFLMSTAAAAGAMRASGLASPNDTVRVACVGVRGQGAAHIEHIRQDAECRDRRALRRRSNRFSTSGSGESRSSARSGRPPSPISASCSKTNRSTPSRSPRRTTTTRCRPSGHARPARTCTVEKPCSHNMFEARQIVAAAKQVQPHGAARHQQPLQRRRVRRPCRQMQEGADRRCLHGARPVLQVARHHRPQAGRAGARRRPLRSVARARAQARVHARTASTTTGTGSGTTATATWATRASTRWTSRAGAWA